MHKLLKRQLKKTGVTVDEKFLEHVNQAYEDADEDRAMLERSLDLASQEMRELYEQLETASKKEIKKSKDRYDALVYELRDHYFFYAYDASFKFTYLSDSIYNITGYSKKEALHTHFTNYITDDKLNEHLIEHAVKAISGEIQEPEKIAIYSKNGSKLYLEVSTFPVFDENRKVTEVKGIARDVTQEYVAQQKLQYLSNHDTLTGILNRHSLTTKLEYIISDASRNKRTFALMYIDIDNFKGVNDALGHDAGDSLLKELVQKVKSKIRQNDLFARIGGDEFVIVLTNCNGTFTSTLAQNIIDEFQSEFIIDSQDINVTLSIGIAFYPRDGEDIDTLLKNADSAMYEIKKNGKNSFAYFSELDDKI